MNPIIIKDPVSERHMAILPPGHDLEIHITDPKAEVKYYGNLLHHDGVAKANKRGQHVYTFKPVDNLCKYLHVSSYYLGEVSIKSGGKKAKVIVYLTNDKSERKNVIAVVNPFNDQIRIKPFQYIEFIFSNDLDSQIEWKWEGVNAPDAPIAIDNVIYRESISDETPIGHGNQAHISYAHPREIFEPGTRLHHLWFRLGEGLLAAMQRNGKRTDDVYLGRLTVTGHNEDDPSEYEQKCIDIFCELDCKHRNQVVKMLNSSNKNPIILPKSKAHNDVNKYNRKPSNGTTAITYVTKTESKHKRARICFIPYTQNNPIYGGCKTEEIKVF